VLHRAICIVLFSDNTSPFALASFCILFKHFRGKVFRYPFINDSKSDVNIGKYKCLNVEGKQLKGNIYFAELSQS
jgi:hypothetical protein